LIKSGIKPILVPTGTLKEKSDFVNGKGGTEEDLLIEIHLNSFNGKVQGSEVLSELDWTKNISKGIAEFLNIKDRGLKPLLHASGKPLYLSTHAKPQLIIIEPFFLDREGSQHFDLAGVAKIIASQIRF